MINFMSESKENLTRKQIRHSALKRFEELHWDTVTAFLGIRYPFIGSPYKLMKAIVDSIPDEILSSPSMIKEYAKRIKASRKERKLSEEKVASLLASSARNISDEENGRKRKINPYFLLGFSLIYEVSPLYLVPKDRFSADEVSMEYVPKERIKNAEDLEYLNNKEKFSIYKREAELLPIQTLKDPESIKIYCFRIAESRKEMGLSIEDVAKKIGVSTAKVQGEEKLKEKFKKNKEEGKKGGKINRYLLLAFSLLYQLSPSVLVGSIQLPDPTNLSTPMMSYSPEANAIAEYIICTLYQKGDDPKVNDRFLNVLRRIYDAPIDSRKKFCESIATFPGLAGLANRRRIDFSEITREDWEKFLRAPKEPETYIAIGETLNTLNDPGKEDIEVLTFFARLASKNTDIKESIIKLFGL